MDLHLLLSLFFSFCYVSFLFLGGFWSSFGHYYVFSTRGFLFAALVFVFALDFCLHMDDSILKRLCSVDLNERETWYLSLEDKDLIEVVKEDKLSVLFIFIVERPLTLKVLKQQWDARGAVVLSLASVLMNGFIKYILEHMKQ